MVKVSTDQARFLAVGFVKQRVVYQKYSLLGLVFTNQWFNGFPECLADLVRLTQKASHIVMANLVIQQAGHIGG